MMAWIVVLIVVGLLAYIRLAPHDVERWHRGSEHPGIEPLERPGGYVWREPVEGEGRDLLARLDAVIMDTPRTRRLTGSVAEGMITYVTRSRVFGFPDYATVGIHGMEDQRYLEINSRLRFGQSDMGVNRSRVRRWLAALKAG